MNCQLKTAQLTDTEIFALAKLYDLRTYRNLRTVLAVYRQDGLWVCPSPGLPWIKDDDRTDVYTQDLGEDSLPILREWVQRGCKLPGGEYETSPSPSFFNYTVTVSK